MKTFRSGALALVSLAVLTGAACEQGLQNPVAPGSPGAAVVGSAGLAAHSGSGQVRGGVLNAIINNSRVILQQDVNPNRLKVCYDVMGSFGNNFTNFEVVKDEVTIYSIGTDPADNRKCGSGHMVEPDFNVAVTRSEKAAALRGLFRKPGDYIIVINGTDSQALSHGPIG